MQRLLPRNIQINLKRMLHFWRPHIDQRNMLPVQLHACNLCPRHLQPYLMSSDAALNLTMIIGHHTEDNQREDTQRHAADPSPQPESHTRQCSPYEKDSHASP